MDDITRIKLIDVQTGRILASDRYEMVRDPQTANILKVKSNYEEVNN
jgi:TolB-like protein